MKRAVMSRISSCGSAMISERSGTELNFGAGAAAIGCGAGSATVRFAAATLSRNVA